MASNGTPDLSRPRIEADLVYRGSIADRIAALLFVALMLALALGAVYFGVRHHAAAPAVLYGLCFLIFGVPAVVVAMSARVRFAFGVLGLSSRGWFGTRTLAYVDIAEFLVFHEDHPHPDTRSVSGMRLIFRSANRDEKPLTLYVQDGFPLDAAVVERLRLQPNLSRRQLKILELAAR